MATTYRTLYNQALNSIKSACSNVSNYGSISNHFKSGYSRTISNGLERFYVRISNPVSSVSAGTVDSQFSSHMNYYGVTSYLDDVVESRGLLNFYCALISFCSAKVRIAASCETSNRYVIYDSSGSISSYTKIPNDQNLIVATDTVTITQTVNKIIGQNKKLYVVRYNYTF